MSSLPSRLEDGPDAGTIRWVRLLRLLLTVVLLAIAVWNAISGPV